MVTLVRYPQEDASPRLREAILALEDTAWPPEPGAPAACWPSDPATYLTSLILVEDGAAVAHAAVRQREIWHRGGVYLAYGLSEVVVSPGRRRQGLGLRVIRAAAAFIEEHEPDVSLFTCRPELTPFYAKGGWEPLPGTCLVGGTRAAPFRSDSLGLAVMARFYSEKAARCRGDFAGADIWLEIGKGELW